MLELRGAQHQFGSYSAFIVPAEDCYLRARAECKERGNWSIMLQMSVLLRTRDANIDSEGIKLTRP
jgi:hypothetical protein